MISLYCILSLITLAQLCEASCPNGFTKHGPSCYKIVRIEATYADAQIYCDAVKTDLVRIETAQEQVFLEGLLQQVASHYDPASFWMAGNDITEENTWIWENTEMQFSSPDVYTNWADGQPDNSGRDENCLEITHKYNWKWNDNNCDDRQFFICERASSEDGGVVFG